MIDSLNLDHFSNLFIRNLTISRSSAKEGVFLYLTSRVMINHSLISDIEGRLNHNSKSFLLDFHYQGVLKLENFRFIDNYNFETIGISGSYQNKILTLSISNFYLFNCSQISQVFEFVGESADAILVTIKNTTIMCFNNPEKTIEFIHLNSINVSIEEIQVKYSKSFSHLTNSQLIINKGKLQFTENTLIIVQRESFFKCIDCQILNNSGPLFVVTIQSSIYLENSEILHNFIVHELRNSLFQIESEGKLMNILNKTKLRDNNTKGKQTFELFYTSFKMIDCEFFGNIQQNKEFVEIVAYGSDIYIERSNLIKDSSKAYGSFISLSLGSNLEVMQSSFFKSISTQNGGAISAENCGIIKISKSLFSNNTSKLKGGAIYSTKTPVIISDSTFEYNSALDGSDLFLTDSDYQISGTNISKSLNINQNNSFALQLAGTSLMMINTTIQNLDFQVSGLECKSFELVTIKNCIFTQIIGKSFGATLFNGNGINGTVYILESQFIDNFSENNGGAISLFDNNLNVKNSIFRTNKAGLDGGALFLNTHECEKCKFEIEGKSNITENYAKRDGGGIKWLDFRPDFDTQIIMSNNSAAYGHNIASGPAFLCIGFKCSENQEKEYSSNIKDIPPGQEISEFLKISLFDSSEQLIQTDNTSVLFLKSFNKDIILSGQTSFTAINGSFHITGLIIRANQGSKVSIIAQTDSISNNPPRNDNKTYKNFIVLNGTLRNCIAGETIESDSCRKCPQTEFLIKPEKSCKACPKGGICPGGSSIWLKPGYYRTTNESEVVYKCPYQNACLGNSSGFQTQCLKGYTGITCFVCDKGYTRVAFDKCQECPSSTNYYLSLAGLIAVFLVISVILVKTTINSAFKTKSKYSIYIKIFTNYLQLVFLISEFDLSWPDYVISFFEAQKFVVTASDRFVSIDCYSGFIQDNFDVYLYKILFYSSLPVIMFLASCVAWLGICFLKESYEYMKRELPLTIIVIFFLIHPGLIKFLYSNFSCKEFDQLGTYLNGNYNFKCWTSVHIKYSLNICLPSIILWSWGIPFIVLVLMIKNRKILYKDQNKIIYGFFYNGYKSSKFYWEFVILYRKTILICILIFLAQVSIPVQVLTVELVLIFSLWKQLIIPLYIFCKLN